MTNTNLINYKDIQNTDIAGSLHKINAQTYLVTKIIKNPYLKSQIQRSGISVIHNYTKAMGTKDKHLITVKHLFSAYGSARETRRWLLIFQKMNLISTDINQLAADYLTLCYQLISMINNIIKKNNIVWSTKENAKIYYHESEKLNLFNTLESLTLDVNTLLSKIDNDSFKNKIIADSCSVLLNIEEGTSWHNYQDLVYCKFLFDSLQQLYVVQSDLETLIAIKDIDNAFKIDAAKAADILNRYTISAKVLIKLLNNTHAKALKEQTELEMLKKQNKK